jgi:stage V sporulation protein D (sporulation-specific penicillin-binding protein)
LPYLGYEASYTEEELKKINISVPEVTNFALEEAKQKISNSKLQYQVVGSGNTVVRQLPEGGNQVLTGGVVILYTEDTGDKTVTVPNFVGLTANEANRAAAKAGLNIEFSGNTTSSGLKSYKQSVEAGQSVNAGTIVTVYFRDETTVDG